MLVRLPACLCVCLCLCASVCCGLFLLFLLLFLCFCEPDPRITRLYAHRADVHAHNAAVASVDEAHATFRTQRSVRVLLPTEEVHRQEKKLWDASSSYYNTQLKEKKQKEKRARPGANNTI